MNWEELLSTQTLVPRRELPQAMKYFPLDDLERDYREIISGVSFRNLQNKAQIFSNVESGIVRTRLTHSLEVSSVAKQLGRMVADNERTGAMESVFGEKSERYAQFFSMTLACAGLIHDMGNPPFGHFGEAAIGAWFKRKLEDPLFQYKGKPVGEFLSEQMQSDLKSFDGNAQTIHLLLKCACETTRTSINVSYSVINTLIKYPAVSTMIDRDSDDIRLHKAGCYLADEKLYKKIRSNVGVSGYVRYPLTYLLEAADDISYLVSDLQDAMTMGFVSEHTILRVLESTISQMPQEGDEQYELQYMAVVSMLEELKNDLKEATTHEEKLGAVELWLDHVRNWLIYAAARAWFDNYEAIMDGSFMGELLACSWQAFVVKVIRSILTKYVYPSRSVISSELKGRKMLEALLDHFIPAVLYYGLDDEEYKPGAVDNHFIRYMPDALKSWYMNRRIGDEAFDLYLRFLMVVDFISGMTDSEAIQLGEIV